MTDMHINLEGDENLRRLLNNIKSRGKTLRVPMKQTGILMLRSVDKNFRAQGRPNKWKPLKQTTIDRRRKEGRGAKILQDNGRLKQSIVYKASNNDVEIGTNVEYARIHNEGGTVRIPAMTIRPKNASVLHWVQNGKDVFAKKADIPARTVNMPKRTFLMFQQEDKENIVRIFRDYLEEIIK